MTDGLELPALDGREPLGFLAALGLLHVLTSECSLRVQLAFSATTACARLHGPFTTTGEVAAAVKAVVDSIPTGGVLPGIVPGFPPPSATGKDPLRQERPGFKNLVEKTRAADTQAADRWLASLVTDLATDTKGRCAITPLTAPSGQQKLRTFFEKPLQEVRRDPAHLHHALTRWQRVEGFTGEYLDHRVLRSSADDVEGRAGNETGVPGATWLAIMATPLLYLTGTTEHLNAALWHSAGHRKMMLWPLWHHPLDVHAVKVLITHPALIPVNDKPTVSTRSWEALGIFNVYGAERQRIRDRTFEGVLTPAQVSKTSSTHHRASSAATR